MEYTKVEREFYKKAVHLVFELGILTNNRTVEELTETFGGGSNAGHLYSIMALCTRYALPHDNEEEHERASRQRDELLLIGEFIKTTLAHNLYTIDESVDDSI